jgi:hypothetical protein
MRPNRVFIPQPLLDAWVSEDRVELTGNELLLCDEGRRYTIAEAVHVVRDVAGGGDCRSLIGKVQTREQLESLGAELFEGSLIVGDDAYDVVPGFVGEPLGRAPAAAPSADANEEELLAQFLLRSL